MFNPSNITFEELPQNFVSRSEEINLIYDSFKAS